MMATGADDRSNMSIRKQNEHLMSTSATERAWQIIWAHPTNLIWTVQQEMVRTQNDDDESLGQLIMPIRAQNTESPTYPLVSFHRRSEQKQLAGSLIQPVGVSEIEEGNY
ncbi:hypothetical protein AnigIFM56816_007306 [Aspergillus niger]|nr:hypothetical protein M752DRAFT_331787 [Aspergillus phoenicis ATCC 13157]GKZ82488.1 hypothetical protein AnigIFM56816_007306 [Aspergillus niger]GKZ94089.1 hypothetical protein AnigIFM59636_007453 [Aspergillus niger]GLA23469.1 hypothetical protein AnigIFM63326_008061 [Aspergillus niger]